MRETILASAYDPEADADEGEEVFANGELVCRECSLTQTCFINYPAVFFLVVALHLHLFLPRNLYLCRPRC